MGRRAIAWIRTFQSVASAPRLHRPPEYKCVGLEKSLGGYTWAVAANGAVTGNLLSSPLNATHVPNDAPLPGASVYHEQRQTTPRPRRRRRSW